MKIYYNKIKAISISIFLSLVLTNFIGIFSNSDDKEEFSVNASTTWTQATDLDFNNGTLDNEDKEKSSEKGDNYIIYVFLGIIIISMLILIGSYFLIKWRKKY